MCGSSQESGWPGAGRRDRPGWARLASTERYGRGERGSLPWVRGAPAGAPPPPSPHPPPPARGTPPRACALTSRGSLGPRQVALRTLRGRGPRGAPCLCWGGFQAKGPAHLSAVGVLTSGQPLCQRSILLLLLPLPRARPPSPPPSPPPPHKFGVQVQVL